MKSKIAPRHHAERVAEATRRLAADTDEELARLTALQAVNPTVRDSELDMPAQPTRARPGHARQSRVATGSDSSVGGGLIIRQPKGPRNAGLLLALLASSRHRYLRRSTVTTMRSESLLICF